MFFINKFAFLFMIFIASFIIYLSLDTASYFYIEKTKGMEELRAKLREI